MSADFTPFVLAERFGWTHDEIMRMTSVEIRYYLAAARIADREAERRARRAARRART